jgi:predicted DNA-binding ribbon-helix-helix protein
MQTSIRKRSIVINGHKTSISLEDAFFDALKSIAKERGSTLADLIAGVDQTRTQGNLSSALRLLVLDFYRSSSRPAALHLTEPLSQRPAHDREHG